MSKVSDQTCVEFRRIAKDVLLRLMHVLLHVLQHKFSVLSLSLYGPF